MSKTMQRRKPLVVDITANMFDRQVDKLSQQGFTVKAIARVTGLSESQVSYRQHQFGVSAMDYRRGSSPLAQSIILGINRQLDKLRHLRTLEQVMAGKKPEP